MAVATQLEQDLGLPRYHYPPGCVCALVAFGSADGQLVGRSHLAAKPKVSNLISH